ncbi:hypothetical protein Agub_g6992 [Astrephomene gubernaculifera]|uniref:Large ribosomal subunit protein uL23c n=1 Tax=Astrephomene gubernaculifera TaxID=47775 RepID=A0AAD3DPD2_9CHLO|nr:hypothetical protein Agub_g6992 [Astrephomene gubernaculifera]
MASTLLDMRLLFRTGYGCLSHTQLGRSGIVETLSTSSTFRSQHTLAESAERRSSKDVESESAPSTSSSAQPAPPVMRFVSSEKRQRPEPPATRLPICFPTLSLQLLRMPDEQLAQLRETGWVREAAFKTTPDVTKLEIAAFLESVYGMSVERVHTINYLGRRRMTLGRFGHRQWWREDDWKKAYVVFRPPPGMEHLVDADEGKKGTAGEEEEEEEEERPVIERIREAVRAPKPMPKKWKWEREQGAK